MALEQAMKRTKGKNIFLTRKLLRELLRAEQSIQSRNDRLSSQLEALKHIDTEEPKRIIQ